MSTYNLRRALETALAATGETIEAIVVGQHDDERWDADPKADENIVITVEAGLAKLDTDYDNGYGGANCHPFYAWTRTRIYFVNEYDGSTGLAWVPRHPTNIEPTFDGQSDL